MATNGDRITDNDILLAMMRPGEPEQVARDVVELFAKRVGKIMTEDEIKKSIRVILRTMRLPIKPGDV